LAWVCQWSLIPDDVLQPHKTWTDQDAYYAKAKELASKFRENFKQFNQVDAQIAKLGGPVQ